MFISADALSVSDIGKTMLLWPLQKNTSPDCTPAATIDGPLSPLTVMVPLGARSWTSHAPLASACVWYTVPALTVTCSPGAAMPFRNARAPYSPLVCMIMPSPK